MKYEVEFPVNVKSRLEQRFNPEEIYQGGDKFHAKIETNLTEEEIRVVLGITDIEVKRVEEGFPRIWASVMRFFGI